MDYKGPMSSSLRALLPAGGTTNQPPLNNNSRQSNTKRRRPYTKNACQNCRTRKSRCDGVKPQCTKCQELGTACFYTDYQNLDTVITLTQENESLKKKLATALTAAASAEKLVDVLNVLRFRPTRTAQNTFTRMRTAPNLDVFLESTDGILRSPFAHTAELAVLPQVQSRYELWLMAEHPKAYPTIDSSVQGRNLIIPAELPSRNDSLISTDYQGSLVKQMPLYGQEPLDTFSNMETTVPGYSSIERSLTGDSLVTFASSYPESIVSQYCDPRLSRINIALWTKVPVTNNFAAGAISLYLETDHASLGLFDTQLFIESLLTRQTEFCSPFFVNALLAFACQGYTSRDPDASKKSHDFEKEAARLWREGERGSDSLPTMTGLVLLWFSHLSHGDHDQSAQYVEAISQMAKRMRLFGVQETLRADDFTIPSDEALATAHAAWGAFNMITMQTLYATPAATPFPPTMPLPEELKKIEDPEDDTMIYDLPLRTGLVTPFSYFCRLWTILTEVLFMYRTPTGLQRVPLGFAGSIYQQLLELSDSLPDSMVRGKHNSSHPLVFHIWFHLVALELFRPFLEPKQQHILKTSTNASADPTSIFTASLKQLKNLILAYSKYTESTVSMFWNIALITVVNAVVKDRQNPDWDFYFKLCIQCYQRLFPYYSAVKNIVAGLLAMAVKDRAISGEYARELMEQFKKGLHYQAVRTRKGGYVLDLDLALTDWKAARVDNLVEQFEEMSVFSQYTTGIVN